MKRYLIGLVLIMSLASCSMIDGNYNGEIVKKYQDGNSYVFNLKCRHFNDEQASAYYEKVKVSGAAYSNHKVGEQYVY